MANGASPRAIRRRARPRSRPRSANARRNAASPWSRSRAPRLEATYLLPSGRSKRVVYYPALTSERTVHLSAEHLTHAWLDAPGVIHRLGHANLTLLFRAYLHALHL